MSPDCARDSPADISLASAAAYAAYHIYCTTNREFFNRFSAIITQSSQFFYQRRKLCGVLLAAEI